MVDGAVGPRAALMAACWATGWAAGAKVAGAKVGMAARPPRLLLAHLISFDDASGVASH